MATKKVVGNGVIATTDYKNVQWTGKTKGGQAITIKLTDAINLGNIDWTMVDKDDTVAEIVFTATQENVADQTEPWEITYVDTFTDTEKKDAIILGAGKLTIGSTDVAITRGGGKFTREVTYRELEFDGAKGPVKGGIEIDSWRCTLTMNTLEIINRLPDLYAGLTETTTP